ncbi:PqqD family protein [Sulfurimonas sp. SAG-AH-194-I05]|nr:PqqD family protein [Sulfurimonas sp. SAG-AH-194-I05]MDF1874497.1 PqqD family protein [Sulfurimonas sp. SAG-AH-194-I05]
MTTVDQLVLDENNTAFHPMMGNSYQLNDISKEILILLKHHKTKEEIIDVLHTKYAISKNELFIDVSDFLTKLNIYGLLG